MYKPIKFLFFSMAFLGLFLTSCQKEKPSKMKTTISRAEAEKMVKEQRRRDVKRIRHFVDKMNDVMSNSVVAGREAPLTIEEMTFGTEAVLNIYYTSPSNRFTEVDRTQDEVTIPLTDGVVADADLVDAFTAVGQKMMDHLDAVDYPNKKVVYVDVVVTNTTATEATLDVRTAVGDRRLDPPPPPPYFTKGWRCGAGVYNAAGLEQVGDEYYNEDDKDAAKLFASTLNEHYRLDHPFPVLPSYGWYTYDVNSEVPLTLFETVADVQFPQSATNASDNPVDNSKDFLFFKIVSSVPMYDEHKFINVDEMNFYYSGLETTIGMIEDPVWQANHPTLGLDLNPTTGSNQLFLGNKFLNVKKMKALENVGKSWTVHIPELIYQKVFSEYGYPSNDDDDTIVETIGTLDLDKWFH